ncbi:DUF2798 domain-containing protein [Paraburkholderia aspalathi]|nr:DUF2798 domain-containing protein [Paraburkholderia aspalathi]
MTELDYPRRKKLPARFAAILTPFIVSMVMTLLVSLVATAKSLGFAHPELGSKWASAWGISWLVAFPALLFVLPLVPRIVDLVCETSGR